MKNFEKIEALLMTKSYDELSADERQLVEQDLTREAYEDLRMGMGQLKGERLKVRGDVKQSLMAEFRRKESTGLVGLFQKTIPAYSLVLPLILIVVFFLYRPTKEIPVFEDRIVEVMVMDTVEVIKTDTLWKEKVVKVPQLVYVTKATEATQAATPEVANRSLSEQKDLLDLVQRSE